MTLRSLLAGLFFGVVTGCAAQPTDLDKREADIDAAYARGEITFVEKEQLKSNLAQERQRRTALGMQMLQGQRQRNPQQQETQWINPPNQQQDIYDTQGNRVGTVRSR